MLYTIERDFTGYSDDQIDAAAFRALLCITFFPGMRWIRSFYDPHSQQSRCFYEANSERDLVHHGTSMAIPIGEVRPVVEVRRNEDGISTGDPIDTADTRDASGKLGVWIVRYRAEGLQVPAVAEKFDTANVRAGGWVRSYSDPANDEVFAVFHAHDRVQVDLDASRVALAVKDVTAVREVLPSDVRELPPVGAK